MASKNLTKIILLAFISLIGFNGTATAEMTPDDCMACHGNDFEKLREATANWSNEWGDKIQPHVYLDPSAKKPHESTVLPECVGCHSQHPIPVPKDYQHEKPTLESCYSCHHMENFQKCSDAGCHAGE